MCGVVVEWGLASALNLESGVPYQAKENLPDPLNSFFLIFDLLGKTHASLHLTKTPWKFVCKNVSCLGPALDQLAAS